MAWSMRPGRQSEQPDVSVLEIAIRFALSAGPNLFLSFSVVQYFCFCLCFSTWRLLKLVFSLWPEAAALAAALIKI